MSVVIQLSECRVECKNEHMYVKTLKKKERILNYGRTTSTQKDRTGSQRNDPDCPVKRRWVSIIEKEAVEVQSVGEKVL